MSGWSELIFLLVLGALFGLLIGVGLDQETRVSIIRVLALFLLVAGITYLLKRPRNRE